MPKPRANTSRSHQDILASGVCCDSCMSANNSQSFEQKKDNHCHTMVPVLGSDCLPAFFEEGAGNVDQ